MQQAIFVGIDVGKDKLDVAVKLKETDSAAGPAKRAHEAWVAKNTDQGAAEIVMRLQAIKPALIALEATGAASATCLSVAPPAGHLAAPGYAGVKAGPAPAVRRRPRPPDRSPGSSESGVSPSHQLTAPSI